MYTKRFIIFFGFVVLIPPVLSMQANPDDCIKGKQFFSKTLLESGACEACPANVQNCYDQPYEDQQRCVGWCRAYQSPLENEERGPGSVVAITISTVAFLVLVVVLAVLLGQPRRRALVVRRNPEEGIELSYLNRVEEQDLRENPGQEILHRNGVEEDGSSLRFGGIQDTEEDKGGSSFSLLFESIDY